MIKVKCQSTWSGTGFHSCVACRVGRQVTTVSTVPGPPRPWPSGAWPSAGPSGSSSMPASAWLPSSWGLWKVQPVTLFPKGLFSSQRRQRPVLIRYPAPCRTDCSENLSQKSRGWEVTLRSPQSSEAGWVCVPWVGQAPGTWQDLPEKCTQWLKPLNCTSPHPLTRSLCNLLFY